jgi:hypothetical protein
VADIIEYALDESNDRPLIMCEYAHAWAIAVAI